MRVLITSFRCATRTGVEVYVRDLAVGLQKHGHVPIIYSPHLGELAEELRPLTIQVVDDLNAIVGMITLTLGIRSLQLRLVA